MKSQKEKGARKAWESTEEKDLQSLMQLGRWCREAGRWKRNQRRKTAREVQCFENEGWLKVLLRDEGGCPGKGLLFVTKRGQVVFGRAVSVNLLRMEVRSR